MTPRTITRDPAPTRDKIITIDGVRVRLVPIPGAERAAIRVRFEILDDQGVIVGKQLSCPSADDCHRAIRAAKHPPPQAVSAPAPAKFNPEIHPAEHKARKAARKARQIAEEGEDLDA